jgi:guanine deaminase
MKFALVGRIITPFPEISKWRFYDPGFVEWDEQGTIINIGNIEDAPDYALDVRPYLITPGLADLHVHPGQYGLRGLWTNNLLDWLEKYIFPGETDDTNLVSNAQLFWESEAKLGITAVAALGPALDKFLDVHFQFAAHSQLRVIMGPTLMDRGVSADVITNPELLEYKISSLRQKWENDKIEIALVPRFPLVCSLKLMMAIGDYAHQYNLPVLTHLAESVAEVEAVQLEYNSMGTYTQVLEQCHLLGQRSAVGHCLHLSLEDIDILHRTRSIIVNCPSANYFLQSGTMLYQSLQFKQVPVSLGSDVGAGPSPDMFEVMRDMVYQQNLNPMTALWHAILGGREQLFPRTGRLEEGYHADLVIWKTPHEPFEELISKMVFLPNSREVLATYVGGEKVWGEGV